MRETGGAKCWGDNLEGQIGDGTKIDRPAAVNVSGGVTTFTALAAGGVFGALMAPYLNNRYGRGAMTRIGALGAAASIALFLLPVLYILIEGRVRPEEV